ncbi:hypothetical protein ACFOUV_00320 [Oceanobacillus longus]|uniref:XRE family transcriptional regulator n=1 Tax=Oceanobacillus longus TaxID=930120 RepID=A0ABV8GUJ5_9BACI
MLNSKFFLELENYIQLYQEEITILYSKSEHYEVLESEMDIQEIELSDYIKSNRQPTLQQVLFSYIDKSGLSDPEVYKKAGIDRKHFSKIRNNANYLPKKNSLIALSFALELNRDDLDHLLSAAGYSLSNSDTNDLVVQFCMEKKMYNLFDVNEALNYFGLEPLLQF